MTEKATVVIEQADVDAANDICDAVLEKISGKGDRLPYWPIYGLSRSDLFNIVASRLAIERLRQ